MTVKELEDKIKGYKDELQRVIGELTRRRTEMTELASKTVRDYEAGIPRLEAEFREKSLKLEEVEKVLRDREAESSRERESCLAHYRSLEIALDAAYQAKHKKLADQEKLFNSEVEYHEMKVSSDQKNLEIQNKSVQDQLGDINHSRLILDREQTAFKKQKENFEQESNATREAEQAALAEAQSKQLEAEEKTTEVVSRLAAVQAQEEQVNQVLSKLAEVEKKEAVLLSKEADLEAEREKMNVVQIKTITETKRMNKRTEELIAFEKKLSDREKNVKTLEARIIART